MAIWNEWEGPFVWVRPNYESALQTFRAWFAVMLVELGEEHPDDLESFLSGIPDPATSTLDDMTFWLFDYDIDWEIVLLPISTSADPLQDFYENKLGNYHLADQERIKQNAARAANWALGDT